MSVSPTSLWWKNCGRSGKQQNCLHQAGCLGAVVCKLKLWISPTG